MQQLPVTVLSGFLGAGKTNPEARLVRAQHGRVPIDAVLDTGLFDDDKAATYPGWAKELAGIRTPETAEYGIGSFVYRAMGESGDGAERGGDLRP